MKLGAEAMIATGDDGAMTPGLRFDDNEEAEQIRAGKGHRTQLTFLADAGSGIAQQEQRLGAMAVCGASGGGAAFLQRMHAIRNHRLNPAGQRHKINGRSRMNLKHARNSHESQQFRFPGLYPLEPPDDCV